MQVNMTGTGMHTTGTGNTGETGMRHANAGTHTADTRETGSRVNNTTITDTHALSYDLIDFAVSTAYEAGQATLKWFNSSGLKVTMKSDGSPVTEADLAAEQIIRQHITRKYPNDAIQGEELANREGRSGRTWVIDPIDGTKAFTQGVPLYSTLLALVDSEGPAVGVIYLPALDECVSAARGKGARWNGELCSVSTKKDVPQSYICTSGIGVSYWPETAFNHIRQKGAHIRTWGDAYGYALVATGRAEAMIDPVCAAWDVAPMGVIIEEAGGVFSDINGETDWRNGSAIGSNGHIHNELLQSFRST